jgi:hypothetical protein
VTGGLCKFDLFCLHFLPQEQFNGSNSTWHPQVNL